MSKQYHIDFMQEDPQSIDYAVFLIATFIKREAPMLLDGARCLTREAFVRGCRHYLKCIEREWCGADLHNTGKDSALIWEFEQAGIITAADRAELLFRAAWSHLNGGRYEVKDLAEEVKTYWRGMGCPDGKPILR